MKKILTFLFLLITTISSAQGDYTQMRQKYNFQKDVRFDDQVRMLYVEGVGSFLKIDANGWLVRGTGTGSGGGMISIDSVTSLTSTLASKQNNLIPIGGILISNDTISLGNLTVADIGGLIDSLASKQDSLIFGYGLELIGDSVYVSMIAQSNVIGLQDSLNIKQNVLVAGTGITIIGDTISSTATGGEWTRLGDKIYNNTDSVGIGTIPSYPFDVAKETRIRTSSYDTTLRVSNSGTGTGLLIEAYGGTILNANGIEITNIDTLFDNNTSLKTTLITHYALRNVVTGAVNVGSGGQTIFNGKVGQNLELKRIRAAVGSGVTVNTVNNTIEVGYNSALVGDTAVNIGGGIGVFKEKSNDSLLFKSFVGSGVSSTDSTIVITSGTPETINLGGGDSIFVGGVADTLKFKTLQAGVGINILSTADEIEIELDGGGFVDLANSQTIAGQKTFSQAVLTSGGISNAGTLPISATGANPITLNTNGTERVRVLSGGNVGINTTTPAYKLDVNGTFSATSVNVDDKFTLPTADGTSGQVMKTDGAGVLTWQNDSGKIYFAGSGLNLTSDTFSIATNGVSNSMLRQSEGTSIIGRSTNGTGNVDDISATSNNEVLRRVGGTLGFGSINLSVSNTVGSSILGVSNGGTGASTAATARTNLGATTVGSNIFTSTNPSAINFLRANADNTVTWRTASEFRSDIGAGTGNGSVTSITAGTGLSGGTIIATGTISLDANLNDINNVAVPSPANGDALIFNGTNWINGTTQATTESFTYKNLNVVNNTSAKEDVFYIVNVPFNNDPSTGYNTIPNGLWMAEGKVTVEVPNSRLGNSSAASKVFAYIVATADELTLGQEIDTTATNLIFSNTSYSGESRGKQVYWDGSDFLLIEDKIEITLNLSPVKLKSNGTTKYYVVLAVEEVTEFTVDVEKSTMRFTKTNDNSENESDYDIMY